jgi:hypothetical protein
MLMSAKHDKGLKARTILFDSWYASVENLKLVRFLDMIFVAPIKDNRLVSLSKTGGYIHVQDIEWTPFRLEAGVSVKLKELPFRVQLFKVVATNGDIDWIITNNPALDLTAQAVRDTNALRWHIEQFHRELKQLTGSEKCQCRKARSQRNHLGYCYLAWFSLKIQARQLGISLYQVRQRIFDVFLTQALQKPPIPAYFPCGKEVSV